MKFFLPALTLLGLSAQGVYSLGCSDTCLSPSGQRCLGKGEVGPYEHMVANSSPCFSYGGNPTCFTSVSASGAASLGGCNAYKAACGYTGPLEQEPDSVCQLNVDKGILDSTLINTVLNKHNELRNSVAGGGYGQEKAANMRQLTWNALLATRAQELADHIESTGTMAHDDNSVRSRCLDQFDNVGQNLASRYESSEVDIINNGILAWFDEYKDFNKGQVPQFVSGYNNGKAVGHFTQVVWADSEEVGCAITDNTSGNRVLVCNYGNGNMIGTPIYEQGTPGTHCCADETKQGNLCVKNA